MTTYFDLRMTCIVMDFAIQLQKAKQKECFSKLCKPLIRAAVVNSREWSMLHFIDDTFIPNILEVVDKLYSEVDMLHGSITELAPYSKQYVLSYCCSSEKSSHFNDEIIQEPSQEDFLQNTFQVT